MNKLNFILLLIVGIGMVCGCKFSSLSESSDNSSRRQSNNRRSDKTTADKKHSRQTNNDDSNEETADSDSHNSKNDSSEESDSSAEKGDTSRLAGKWVWAHTGSSTYSTGGSYMGGNGSRFTYEFSEDGEVEFTGIMNVMQGSCRMQIFKIHQRYC